MTFCLELFTSSELKMIHFHDKTSNGKINPNTVMLLTAKYIYCVRILYIYVFCWCTPHLFDRFEWKRVSWETVIKKGLFIATVNKSSLNMIVLWCTVPSCMAFGRWNDRRPPVMTAFRCHIVVFTTDTVLIFTDHFPGWFLYHYHKQTDKQNHFHAIFQPCIQWPDCVWCVFLLSVWSTVTCLCLDAQTTNPAVSSSSYLMDLNRFTLALSVL